MTTNSAAPPITISMTRPYQRGVFNVDAPPLATADIIKIYQAMSARTSTGMRNRTLLALMWRLGMRPQEALQITGHDVDLEEWTITLGERLIGIDPVSRDALAAWLERRGDLGLTDEMPVASTLQGGPLHSAYIREMLPRVGRSVGIADPRVYAMAMRYACASELAHEGFPLEVILAQMGMEPASSAAAFLPRPTEQTLVRYMRGRPVPRGV